MIQSRCWLAAALAILVAALPVTVSASEKGKSKTHAPKPHATKNKFILKTYPVASLIRATKSQDADVLISAITRAVKPESWDGKGGSATIDYFPKTQSLVIKQTAAGHRQVDVVLKTLIAIYYETPAPLPREKDADSTSQKTSARTAPSGQENAYGHLVLDNVRVNAMGINCTIKRVRLMYKGDNNLADAAKSAVANGETCKPQGIANVLNAVLEGMGVCSTPCAAPPCSAAPIYASVPCAMPAPNASMAYPSTPTPTLTAAPGSAPVPVYVQPTATPPSPISAIPNAAAAEMKDEQGKPQKMPEPRSPSTR